MPQWIAASRLKGVDHLILPAEDHDFGRQRGARANRRAADLAGPMPDFFELFPIDAKERRPFRAEVDQAPRRRGRSACRGADLHVSRLLATGQIDDMQLAVATGQEAAVLDDR